MTDSHLQFNRRLDRQRPPALLCPLSHGRPGVLTRILAALSVLSSLTVLLPTFSSTASAQQPALPNPIPNGYVIVADDDVTWLYPESAESEITALRAALPTVVADLRKGFGTESDGPLDIRVALHAEGMAKLAPAHSVPGYAQGVAYPAEGLILLTFASPFTFGRPDMEKVLIHEMSHVALHRAVGGQAIPRWFTEGVAIDQADEQSLTRLRTLWEGTLRKQLLPLSQLGRAFPKDHHAVNLAYAQSASLVRHLRDGVDDATRFKTVLSSLRAGQPFGEAIRDGYGVSLQYIEREWRTSLLRNLGRWPSLLTGLTALWALIAVLLLVGYIRARRKHHRTLAIWQAREAEEAQDARNSEREAEPDMRSTPAPLPSPQRSGRSQTDDHPHRVDEVMDRLRTKHGLKKELPTIEHDGEHYTLH